MSTYRYSASVKYNIKGSQPCTVLCYLSQIQHRSIWNICVLCCSKRAAFFVDSFRLLIWGQLYIYIMIQKVLAGGRVLNNLILHNKFLFRYILQSEKNAWCVDHVLSVGFSCNSVRGLFAESCQGSMSFMKVGLVIVVLQGINEFFPVNLIFWLNMVMFAVEYLHVIPFSSYKFCVYNERDTVLGGIN